MNTTKKLSEGQERIYKIIQNYKKSKGYAPSFRTIAEEGGIALSTVMTYLRAMRKKGVVIWDDYVSHSIRILI